MDRERTTMQGISQGTGCQDFGRAGAEAAAFETWLRLGLAARYGDLLDEVPDELLALLRQPH
jgi:hypothetical protein